MIMDKNGKLFGKISVVDIAVILIVVVGVCGIFYTKSETWIESEKFYEILYSFDMEA